MKKNKGFTLIELIAVVVIMGLILLIVFPATSRLMRDNEEQEYQTYYDIVQKSIELYSRTRKDDIGGTGVSGCVDDTTITDLIKQDYVKEYENDDEIECKSPGDYTAAELSQIGVDPSKYVNIRIENKNGVISTKVSMICKKKNSKKVYYSKLIEKEGECQKYVAEVTNSLYKAISDPSSSTKLSVTSVGGGDYFVNGSSSNNYLWYSGKMWRIVSYNSNERTVKLVTDNLQSLVLYDASTTNYGSSNIDAWLNNNFLNTLNNSSRYLLDTKWNYSAVSNGNSAPPVSGEIKANEKVGMLNLFEYNKIKGFLNKGYNFWLLSKKDNGNVWFVGNDNTAKSGPVNEFYGVRPAVVLRPNIAMVSGGQGTVTNPYRLIGDTSGNIGSALNMRFPGEYVKINGLNFRIVSRTSSYTRLVAVDALNIADLQFHYFNKVYSDDTYIGDYLNKTWAVPIADKLESADFCRNLVNKTVSQSSSCQTTDIHSMKIAVPRIGDMYTVPSNKEYWTINNAEEEKIVVVIPTGNISSKGIEDASGVRPVVNLKSTVTIAGGNGTPSNPYTIQ